MLRAVNPERNVNRSWVCRIERDLFGACVVSVTFGRAGTHGRTIRRMVSDDAAADRFLASALVRRRGSTKRRGAVYHVIETLGFDSKSPSPANVLREGSFETGTYGSNRPMMIWHGDTDLKNRKPLFKAWGDDERESHSPVYSCLESVQDHVLCWQSLRSISRIDAQRRNAIPFRLRHSQSLLRRRQRFNQAMVRSTIQRLYQLLMTATQRA